MVRTPDNGSEEKYGLISFIGQSFQISSASSSPSSSHKLHKFLSYFMYLAINIRFFVHCYYLVTLTIIGTIFVMKRLDFRAVIQFNINSCGFYEQIV